VRERRPAWAAGAGLRALGWAVGWAMGWAAVRGT
jgi:hypothetical protein